MCIKDITNPVTDTGRACNTLKHFFNNITYLIPILLNEERCSTCDVNLIKSLFKLIVLIFFCLASKINNKYSMKSTESINNIFCLRIRTRGIK